MNNLVSGHTPLGGRALVASDGAPRSNRTFSYANEETSFQRPSTPSEILSDISRALAYRAWIIVATLVVFGLAAAAVIATQEPYYRASSAISIDPRTAEGINQQQAPTVLLADALVVDSEVEVLSSNSVLTRVVQNEPFQTYLTEYLAQSNETLTPIQRDAFGLSLLRSHLLVEREARTFVIRITYEGPTPEFSAQVANDVARAYLEAQSDSNREQAERAAAWINDQLDGLSQEVVDAEREIAQFRLDNKVPPEGSVNQVERQIAANDARIVELRAQIAQSSSEVRAIDRAIENINVGNLVDYTYLAEILESTTLLAVGKQLSQPDDNSNAIERLRELATSELETLRNERSSTLEISPTEIEVLQEDNRGLERERAQLSEKQAQVDRLTRSLDALRSQEEQLLERFEASQRSDLYFVSSARLIEEALPPLLSSNSSPTTIAIAALLGATILGLAIVFIVEQFNDGMRRSDDVTRAIGKPYLGALPTLTARQLRRLPYLINKNTDKKMRRRDRRQVALMSFAARQPKSKIAETVRRIVFETSQKHYDNVPVLATVSPFRGEGKSFLAANLAFYLASRGKNVLLIDGDVHKGYLTKSLEPLANVQEGSGFLRRLYEGLDFCMVDFSDTTMSADRVDRLLQVASDRQHFYDMIVLDTPALAYVNDALEYSDYVSDTVAVFQWGKSSATVTQRILRSNAPIFARLLGCCLSRAPSGRSERFEGIPVEDYYSSN